MKAKMLIILSLLLMAAAQKSWAIGQNITICSIDGQSEVSDRGEDTVFRETSLNGPFYVPLLYKLSSPLNFGNDGVVNKTWNFEHGFEMLGSISELSLVENDCEIFVLAGLGNGVIDEIELNALHDWVLSTNGVLIDLPIIFYHSAGVMGYGLAYNDYIIDEWQAEDEGGLNLSHPILNGPFGAIGTVESIIDVPYIHQYFSNTDFATVLMESSGAPTFPLMIERDFVTGLAIYLSSTGPFNPSALSAGPNNLNGNDALALNLFAYAASRYNQMNFAVPPPTIINPTDLSITSDSTPAVNGTAYPGSQVSVGIDEILGTGCSAIADVDTGEWSCEVFPALPEAVYTLSAYAEYDGSESPNASITFEVGAIDPPVITQPNDGQAFQGMPTLRGTAEAGLDVYVELLESPAVSCSSSVSGLGAWGCIPVPNPVADGVYTASAVVQRDGESSDASEITFIIDSLPPDMPEVVTPTNGMPVMGFGEVGATVHVSTLSGATCEAVVQLDGSWSCHLVPDPEQDDTIIAYQVDSAGNESAQNVILLAVDLVAPDPPIIAYPVDGMWINDATPLVSGTTDPGVMVTVSDQGISSCEVQADGVGDWSCEMNSALSEGMVQLSATARNEIGNTSNPAIVNFNVDTINPLAPVINMPTNGNPVTGMGEPGIIVTVSTPSGSICQAQVEASGQWECVLMPVPQHGESITAIQVDLAGNQSMPSIVGAAIDLIPPATPEIVAPTENMWTNDATPSVIGTAEAGLMVEVSGPALSEPCMVQADGLGNWACELAELDDGLSVQISAIARDLAGNPSEIASVGINIDTVAPSAPLISAPTNGNPVFGTGESGILVTVSTPSGSDCQAIVQANGSWECVLNPAPLHDEDIMAIQVDFASNFSEPTVVMMGIDVMPPAQPSINSPIDGSQLDLLDDLHVSGMAEPGMEVTVLASNGSSCNALADLSGQYSCLLEPGFNEPGDVIIQAVTTDEAGNSSDPTQINVALQEFGDVFELVVDSPDSLVTTEMGTSTFIELTLTSEPADDVFFTLQSSDESEGVISQNEVTFTSVNWNDPVQIEITGVDDAELDYDQMYTILISDFISSDINYDGVNPPDLPVINVDDEIPLTDLAVEVEQCYSGARPNELVNYTYRVINLGNIDVGTARFVAMPNEALSEFTWHCHAYDGALCQDPSGAGIIQEIVNVPVGSYIEYQVSAIVSGEIDDVIDVFMDVTLIELTDDNPMNNSGILSDPIYSYIFRSNFDCELPVALE